MNKSKARQRLLEGLKSTIKGETERLNNESWKWLNTNGYQAILKSDVT